MDNKTHIQFNEKTKAISLEFVKASGSGAIAINNFNKDIIPLTDEGGAGEILSQIQEQVLEMVRLNLDKAKQGESFILNIQIIDDYKAPQFLFSQPTGTNTFGDIIHTLGFALGLDTSNFSKDQEGYIDLMKSIKSNRLDDSKDTVSGANLFANKFQHGFIPGIWQQPPTQNENDIKGDSKYKGNANRKHGDGGKIVID